MITAQHWHYIIISLVALLWGAGLLYYTEIQSYYLENQSPETTEKFNTLATTSWSESTSWTASYVLPNGLVLFDTSVPQKEFDYTTDSSITKFVSAKVPLTDKEYVPDDLVPISSEWLIIQWSNAKLREIANKKLNELAGEFYTAFQDKLVIVSSYRSYSYQKNLEKGCSLTLCARAWYSEHQLGLTIDIFAATTAGKFLSKAEFKTYYEWLMQNAHRYWWHNSYQKGVATDTYQQEPRHWRYLGRELATELHDNQQTFAEWYNKQLSQQNI